MRCRERRRCRVLASGDHSVITRCVRIQQLPRRRIDKLGVTGSSPVQPIAWLSDFARRPVKKWSTLQAGGHRFDPDTLHFERPWKRGLFFVPPWLRCLPDRAVGKGFGKSSGLRGRSYPSRNRRWVHSLCRASYTHAPCGAPISTAASRRGDFNSETRASEHPLQRSRERRGQRWHQHKPHNHHRGTRGSS
jgi:hypothetical protein